jgi:hypothetical protein
MDDIYIGTKELVKYIEYGDYSDEEHATNFDLDILISNLSHQIEGLKLLKYLLNKYGEAKLVYWKTIYNDLKYLNSYIEGAKQYELNNKIQGDFYKKSYDNLEKNQKELEKKKKEYQTFPEKFKTYITKYI